MFDRGAQLASAADPFAPPPSTRQKEKRGFSEITEITASGGMALITGLGSGGQCLERKYSIQSPRQWSASTDKATLG